VVWPWPSIAQRIAAQAPLAVQATLAEARTSSASETIAARERLRTLITNLFATSDANEGIAALIARRHHLHRRMSDAPGGTDSRVGDR
jgi:hypothetical protein